MANLLVVDDDPVLLGLLGKILRQQGHAVTTADGGAAALAAVRTQCFDLVITDLMMPEMDGFMLVRRLRAESACAETLLLVVTSNLDGPDPLAAQAAGADAWAPKPLNLERLSAMTTRLLASRVARAQPSLPTQPLPEGL